MVPVAVRMQQGTFMFKSKKWMWRYDLLRNLLWSEEILLFQEHKRWWAGFARQACFSWGQDLICCCSDGWPERITSLSPLRWPALVLQTRGLEAEDFTLQPHAEPLHRRRPFSLETWFPEKPVHVQPARSKMSEQGLRNRYVVPSAKRRQEHALPPLLVWVSVKKTLPQSRAEPSSPRELQWLCVQQAAPSSAKCSPRRGTH